MQENSPISIRPLVEALAEMPDFRSRHGRRYSLAALLSLSCAAILCGYTSYGAMAEWAKNYGAPLSEQLGFKGGKTPSVGTLFTIFSRLDKIALERVLGEWSEGILAQLPGKKAISLDGKTLRASKKQAANESHLLSAVSHGLGLTLFQAGVGDKTNEITAAQAVLSALVLEGRVVTVDALLTQREVAAQILSKGGTT
jgi:hypothetical protein